MKHLLLVDDETNLLKGLQLSLEQAGYRVSTATNGREALEQVVGISFDLIVLDLMLPEVDGLTVCREIRRRSRVPILMLTAKDDDLDKIIGLELGADDYVTKPFNTRELLARIAAIFRRMADWSQPTAPRELVAGELTLIPLQRQAWFAGRPLDLTPREYDLLELFVSHPRQVYTRPQLLDLVWGYDFDGADRTVDVHMRRLREKIEPNPAAPQYLITRRGVGYLLEVPE